MEGTRKIKCNADERCPLRLDAAEPYFSPKAKMQTSPFRRTKKADIPLGMSAFLFLLGKGLERAAPVCTLVQKLRAGEQFLARGRVHRRKTHPVKDVGFLLFSFGKYCKRIPSAYICRRQINYMILLFRRLPRRCAPRNDK